jgi:hypothetical protein
MEMQSSRTLRHMPSPARDLGHTSLKLKLNRSRTEVGNNDEQRFDFDFDFDFDSGATRTFGPAHE